MEAYIELYEGPEFDIDYMYAQIWTLSLMAFLFGPLLPSLFLYGFFGMLILDLTVRLRIAYSVKKFPRYDDSLNQWNLFWLRESAVFYLISASYVYSNQHVFQNVVYVNKSANVYNPDLDHSQRAVNYSQLNPGTIFVIAIQLYVLSRVYRLVSFTFFKICPRLHCCPKIGSDHYWGLEDEVLTKCVPNFYEALSDA